jgi:hypothetical protein
LFHAAGDHARYLPDLLPALAPLGIGCGIAFPALMTLAMSTATPEDSGLVSGLVNTGQQVGGAIGLSILTSLSTRHSSALLHAGRPAIEALTGGYHLAFEIGAIAVAAALGLAIGLAHTPSDGDGGELVQLFPDEGATGAEPLANAA